MKAVFIGSGNVATHLSMALKNKGIEILQVYSRTSSNAELLAQMLGCPYTSLVDEIRQDADIYFYALKDSAFKEFLRKFDMPQAMHVHTAGSIHIDEFEGFASAYGVFYPLQTFSKAKSVDFSEIPVCIEASSNSVQEKLVELARLITNRTYHINSEQRKSLHLAAVFACNYTNYLYDVASQILSEADISFDILKPLIQETADKVQDLHPYNAQTGPAVRYDKIIIEKHLKMLHSNQDFKKIYELLAKGINNRHSTKK